MLKLMRRIRRVRPVLPPPSAFTGFRFPWEVIVLAVRWYLRYGLSYRDVEELLAERGVRVDHVTIYRPRRYDRGPDRRRPNSLRRHPLA
jgi:transposase-like protein